LRTKVVLGAIIVIAVLVVSVGYYVTMTKPMPGATTTATAQEPSDATLVPTIIVAQATPDSNALANTETRLYVDDITSSGLGISTKLFIGDDAAVIYGLLYIGKEPGGYDAWDMGYSGLQGTADRLADPNTLLVRGVSRYTQGSFNYPGYNNSQYDSLYYQQQSELDLQKRKFLVDWMTQNYIENILRIPVGHPIINTAINKDRVSGYILYGNEALGNIWTYLNATSLVGADTFNVAVITAGEGDISPATYNIFTYSYAANGLYAMFMHGVYDNLLKSRPDGSVTPALATSWTALNSTNIVVRIRSDAKWSDGKAVTAQDVAFTFSYLKNTGQPAILQPYISSLGQVIALNSTTVQFVLKTPYAPFITNTLTQIPILPQHIFDGLIEKQGVKNPSDLKLTPDMFVGSGPWKMVKFDYGSEVVFERNPYYFVQPHYKFIRFVYFTSHLVAVTALEQGQIDTLPSDDPLSTQEIQELSRYPSIQVVRIPTATVWDISINMRHLPFADRAFRQALAHVINYDKIVSVVFGGNFVRGAGFIAPVSQAWFDPPLVDHALNTVFSYNLTQAKKILSDAGYQWDSQGRLHYPESYLSKGLAAIVADNYNFAVPKNEVISTAPTPQGAPATPQAAPPFPQVTPVSQSIAPQRHSLVRVFG
jgi:peptide/nickel transport system substrate-binding protein